jgi:3-hydroxymyristoyl/3-hydroxydecanoyl-(acyl carrier protein) dehydratase
MRYLMIDRVLEWTPFQRVVAAKNVSLESDVLEHHFPGFPLFPGALTVEAMAQAAGYLVVRSLLDERKVEHAAALSVIDRVHLRRPVYPGDQLRIDVQVTDWGETAVRVTAHASVEGQPTARGRLVMVHRPVDGTQYGEAMRQTVRWMRGLERPSGLI